MFLAGILGALLLTQAADPTNTEDELRRARNEYAFGNYDVAADKLRHLLYPMKLSTDAQVIEARKFLALSSYLLNRPDDVKEEFSKLLYLDPDYQLDPFSVAPAVVDQFEEIRRNLQPELDIIRQRKSEAKRATPEIRGVRRIVTTRIIERSEVASLLPFGVGQFQNDDIAWGLALCVSQVVLLGANIGSYLWGLKLQHYSAAQRGLVQSLVVTQYASLALFGATWSVGVFQARSHFTPTIIEPPVVHDEPLEALSALAPGLSLQWRF